MVVNSYRTIQRPGQGIYKEKGSKFLAFAYPVHSETDVKEHLELLRKEYFDARHHCFAWMLGADKRQFRAFDDGEPNHSAGDPILGQIRSNGLTNILVVVVRYFGGVKLGVGGLISAYRAAAEDALKNVSIVEVEVTEEVEILFLYDVTSDVMRIIKELSLKISNQHFDSSCSVKVTVPLRQKEKLLANLKVLVSMGKKLQWRENQS